MNDTNRKNESSMIVTSDSNSLANKSAPLFSRGLRAVSNWDALKLLDTAKDLVSADNEREIIDILKKKIPHLITADSWSLLLRSDPDLSRNLEFKIIDGKEFDEFPEDQWDTLLSIRIKPGAGIAGWVLAQTEGTIVADVCNDSRFISEIDGRARSDVRSVIAAPLRYKGDCLGVLELVNCASSPAFTNGDLAVVQALADFTAIGMVKAQQVDVVTDLLIGEQKELFNRGPLDFTLGMVMDISARFGEHFSLIGIEFLGLKDLLSSLGVHGSTNLVLEIIDRLKSACGLVDHAAVYRYYFEKFWVILGRTTKERASEMTLDIEELLGAAIGDKPVRFTIASVTYPEDGERESELLQRLRERLRSAQAKRTR